MDDSNKIICNCSGVNSNCFKCNGRGYYNAENIIVIPSKIQNNIINIEKDKSNIIEEKSFLDELSLIEKISNEIKLLNLSKNEKIKRISLKNPKVIKEAMRKISQIKNNDNDVNKKISVLNKLKFNILKEALEVAEFNVKRKKNQKLNSSKSYSLLDLKKEKRSFKKKKDCNDLNSTKGTFLDLLNEEELKKLKIK